MSSSLLLAARRSASVSGAVRGAARRAAATATIRTRRVNATATTLTSFAHADVSVAGFHTRCASLAAAPTVVATPGSTIDFNLADIGEGIAECEVLKWFVAEGDTIAQFDKVCEVRHKIHTDMHHMDIHSLT